MQNEGEKSDILQNDIEELKQAQVLEDEVKPVQTLDKKQQSLKELETGEILPTFLKIAIPTMIGFSTSAVCNTFHSMIIGRHIGDAALTGHSNFLPTEILFYSNPIVSAAYGAATLMSEQIGKKNLEEAARVQAQIYNISIIHGITIPLIFVFWLPQYLKMLGVTESILPYALQYGYVATIFLPIAYALNNLSALLRCQNQAMMVMYRAFFISLLNLFLAVVFVVFFNMGVRGTAISLVITCLIMGIHLVWFLFSKHSVLPMKVHMLKPDWRVILRIYYLGLSNFVNAIPLSLQNLLATVLLTKFSNTEEQAKKLQLIQGICSRILNLFNFPLAGLTSGIQPMFGCSIGSKNYKRLVEVMKKSYMVTFAIGLSIYLLIMIFAYYIVSGFSKTVELYAQATKLLRLCVSGLVMTQFLQITNVILQQEKKANLAVLIQCIRACVSLTVQIFVPMITKNPEHMFFSQVCGDIVGGCIGIGFMFYHFKKYTLLAKTAEGSTQIVSTIK